MVSTIFLLILPSIFLLLATPNSVAQPIDYRPRFKRQMMQQMPFNVGQFMQSFNQDMNIDFNFKFNQRFRTMFGAMQG